MLHRRLHFLRFVFFFPSQYEKLRSYGVSMKLVSWLKGSIFIYIHFKKIGSLQCITRSNFKQMTSPKLSSISIASQQQNVMKFVLSICFIAATILSILPCEYRDGNRIPSTIIFRQLPSIIFHAFALLLVLAFSGSFISLMIEDDTEIVRQICWYISVTSMAAVGSILAYSISSSSLNWVSYVMRE